MPATFYVDDVDETLTDEQQHERAMAALKLAGFETDKYGFTHALNCEVLFIQDGDGTYGIQLYKQGTAVKLCVGFATALTAEALHCVDPASALRAPAH